MSLDTWDTETWLDITVNAIPLGIMLVFIGLFLVITPWGIDLTPASLIQYGLIVLMMVLLAYLTYLAAEKI